MEISQVERKEQVEKWTSGQKCNRWKTTHPLLCCLNNT